MSAEKSQTAPPGVPLDLDFDQTSGTLVRLSPLIRRIVAPNPGPMTFRGTCTYVVGSGNVAIIDPGPEEPRHVEALLAALGSERVSHIFVTHTHRDHSPAARLLKAATGAPIVGCAPYRPARPPFPEESAAVTISNDLDHRPDRELADGERIELSDVTLEAVATHGHTMNHLAFALREENALFTGDHVMAWSTTIVSPPTGSMTAYLASLEKLVRRQETVYWPGHGGPVRQPRRFVRALQHHRRQREYAILTRLKAGDRTPEAIVAAIYDKLDPRLKRAAMQSVFAHLEDLVYRGKVAPDGEAKVSAAYALII